MSRKINPIEQAIREIAKKDYEAAVHYYTLLFCTKHQLNIEDCYWIGDDIGGVFTSGDFFFDFHNMKTDIDLDADEEMIFDYQEYYIKEHQAGNQHPINYQSFIKLNR